MSSLSINVSTSGEMLHFLKYIGCHQAVISYGCCQDVGMVIELSNVLEYIPDDHFRGYEIIGDDRIVTVRFQQKRINLGDLIKSLRDLIEVYGDWCKIIDIKDGIMKIDIHHE
jgi:hypothetical protein